MQVSTKKPWASPRLEELPIDKTLGGPFQNFTEQDFGEPGHVPLGQEYPS